MKECVRDVKQQNENHQKVVRQIEESLVSLIQKYVMTEKMTKKDILEADTKEAPVKTPVKTPTKPDRKSPYQPNINQHQKLVTQKRLLLRLRLKRQQNLIGSHHTNQNISQHQKLNYLIS
jgi:hypothetical protein